MNFKSSVNSLTFAFCIAQLATFGCSSTTTTPQHKAAAAPQGANSESTQYSDDPEIKNSADEDFYLSDALDSDEPEPSADGAEPVASASEVKNPVPSDETAKHSTSPVAEPPLSIPMPHPACFAYVKKHVGPFSQAVMARFDIDKSKDLSLKEFMMPFSRNRGNSEKSSFITMRTEMFKKYSGADALLSLSELQNLIASRMSANCVKRATHDNGTHAREVKKHHQEFFDRMDLNKDGNVTRDEYMEFRKSQGMR